MRIPPILLLVFRRADLVHQQIEGLRPFRPSRLYIAADGPRPGNFRDYTDCEAVRRTLGEIDWPCDVKKLIRPRNLGVKLAVSQGIDWFFQHEEEGIILEEDCFPHGDFLTYCAALLERYRHEPQIMQISGTNFQPTRRAQGASYFFSRYNHVWGWATWRRAWAAYRPHLEGLDTFLAEANDGFWVNHREKKYWRKIFEKAKADVVQSWAYRWTFSIWAEGGLCVYPEHNLVSNRGFDGRATNTNKVDKSKSDRPVEPLGPLVHPSPISRCRAADRWTFEHLYWGDPWSRAVHRTEKLLSLTAAAFVQIRHLAMAKHLEITARTASEPEGGVVRFRKTPGSPLAPGAPATVYTPLWR